MIGTRVVCLTLLCLVIAISSATAANKYQIKQDAQAVAVAQAAFIAMGGPQAVLGYRDSLASGAATISTGGSLVSYPITMKSK